MTTTTTFRTLLTVCSFLLALSAHSQTTLVETNSVYEFYDDGDQPADDAQGNAWYSNDYSASWSSFEGPLGFGSGNHNEVLKQSNTVYFRHQWNIESTQDFDLMFFNLLYNDGAIIYLNGKIINRTNMPQGDVDYSTSASSNIADQRFRSIALPHLFIEGLNTVAVEIHNSADNSDSNLSFGLEVIEYHEVCETVGFKCDDQNPNTINDKINNDCECEGHICDLEISASETQEIYPGQSVNLEVVGEGTYFWSTGETTRVVEVTPGTTTGYSVTVTDEFGCEEVADMWVNILECTAEAYAGEDVVLRDNKSAQLTANESAAYMWNNGETTQTINVSPVQDQSYSVTITDENGCYAKDDVTVFVSACNVGTPCDDFDASTYDDQLGEDCECFGFPCHMDVEVEGNSKISAGESTTLTAEGGVSYFWNNGMRGRSITVSPVATTEYSVIIINSNGCEETAYITVVINEPACEVGAPCNDDNDSTYDDQLGEDCECFGFPCYMDVEVSGNVTIVLGESATITAEGGVDYIWDNGMTGPSITVAPSITTQYAVTILGTNNCEENASVTIVVIEPVCEVGTPCNDDNDSTYDDQLGEDCECFGFPCDMDVEVSGNVTIVLGESATIIAEGGIDYVWDNGMTGPSITVAPSVTTQYAVTILGTNNCEENASVTVVVIEPACEVGSPCNDNNEDTYNDFLNEDCECVGFPCHMDVEISGDTEIYFGQTATIFAEGGTSYSWNNGMQGPVVQLAPSTTTNYFVTITDGNGCEEIVKVTINVLDCNVEEEVQTFYSIFLGDEVTLSANGGSYYLWNNDATTTEITVQPIENTVYTVTVYDNEFCFETKEILVEVIEDLCRIGNPCDDNDPLTTNDAIDENCECVGEINIQNDETEISGIIVDENGSTAEAIVEEDCTPITSFFPQTRLKHFGSESAMTTYEFANLQAGVSFTISGINAKLNSTVSKNYVDVVDVSYVNEFGQEVSYGTFNGEIINEVEVDIADNVQKVIVSLVDGYDGYAPKINISLGNMSSCSLSRKGVSANQTGLQAGQSELIEASLQSNLVNGRLILNVTNPNTSSQPIYAVVIDANGAPVISDAVNGEVLPGSQSEYIDISTLRPGLYYLKIQVGRQTITLKFVVAE